MSHPNSQQNRLSNAEGFPSAAFQEEPTPQDALTLLEALELGGFDSAECENARNAERETGYSARIPAHFAKAANACRNDALWRQVLPAMDELMESSHFTTNPLQEQAPPTKKFSPIFLLQKYAGRALMMSAMECSGNCRFCFRRHVRTEFKSLDLRREYYVEPLFQLAKNVSIREVILSGGDPLTLSNDLFFWLLREFQKIEHLKQIRVHTRVPIFSPEKISPNFSEFLKLFSENSTQVLYFVLHVNHPDELTPEVEEAVARLRSAGVSLLQQGVLLRGVNDSAEILAELYEKLIRLHILPYYLHQLDQVQGAAHFEVEPAVGREIMKELRARLPGYAVPRYVREIPGETGKTPLE